MARARALNCFEDAVPDRHSDWTSSMAEKAFWTTCLKHFQLLNESPWERERDRNLPPTNFKTRG